MIIKPHFSTKRLQIARANLVIVVVVSAVAFVVTFAFVASKTLLNQRSYQARVIKEERKTKLQLDANIKAVEELKSAYQIFLSGTENILGGDPAGTGPLDGDNARIILDGLPAEYDFPAVTASLEKLILERNVSISSIGGTDDEVAQKALPKSSSPVPTEIPFTFAVNGSYDSIKDLVGVLERSIRPMHFQHLTLSVQDQTYLLDVTAKTFYQLAEEISVTVKDLR